MADRRVANPRMAPLPQNRKNLETVQRYAYQQGLIQKIVRLDDLFADTDLGDAAGNEEV